MALSDPILSAALNHISLDEIKKEMGPAPWVRLVVMADHIFGAVICQPPGHENDRHVHGYDEWWVIMEGEIDWIVEGREDSPVHAKAGDFVFVPAMTFHHIFPKGDGPSIRLGIALPGQGHLHERPAQRCKIEIEY
jgi:mannose-6-phosphate isomerase-like protein (cupin superfamily)